MVRSTTCMLLGQLLHRSAQLACDRCVSIFVRQYRAKIERRADDQPHLTRTRNAFPLRPSPKRPVEITRKNRDVPASDQRADAWFEILELSGLRSRSFGKNDENIAGVREELAADRQAMTDLRLTGERKRVDDDRRDPGAWHAF